jgi:hypothetical protein
MNIATITVGKTTNYAVVHYEDKDGCWEFAEVDAGGQPFVYGTYADAEAAATAL